MLQKLTYKMGLKPPASLKLEYKPYVSGQLSRGQYTPVN